MQPKPPELSAYSLGDCFFGQKEDGLNVLGLGEPYFAVMLHDGGVRYRETDPQGKPRVRDSWGNTPSYAQGKAENYQRQGIDCEYIERFGLWWYAACQLPRRAIEGV